MAKSAEELITEFDKRVIKVTEAASVFEYDIETTCLICGEGVPVPRYHNKHKICEKCKAAVMKVRAEDGK